MNKLLLTVFLAFALALTSCSIIQPLAAGLGDGLSQAGSRPRPTYTNASYTSYGCTSSVECGPGLVCASNGYGGPGQCVGSSIR